MFYCSTTVGVCVNVAVGEERRERREGRMYSFEVFCPTCVSHSPLGGLLQQYATFANQWRRWSSALHTKDFEYVYEQSETSWNR